jgi:hypothetical protein
MCFEIPPAFILNGRMQITPMPEQHRSQNTRSGRRLRELRQMADATQFDVERVTGLNRARLSCAECEHIQLREWEYSAVERTLLEMIRQRAAQFAGLLETTDKKSRRLGGSSACDMSK